MNNFDIIYIIANTYLDPQDARNFLNVSRQLRSYRKDMISMLIRKNLEYFGITINIEKNYGIYNCTYSLYKVFRNHPKCVDSEDLIEHLVENEMNDSNNLHLFRALLQNCKHFRDFRFIMRTSTLKHKKLILTTIIDIPNFEIDFISSFQNIFLICDIKLLEKYFNLYKTKKQQQKFMISKEKIKGIVIKGAFQFLNKVIELFIGDDIINMGLYVKSIIEGIINMKRKIDFENDSGFKELIGKMNLKNKENILKIVNV
jgi:hypothetical protein